MVHDGRDELSHPPSRLLRSGATGISRAQWAPAHGTLRPTRPSIDLRVAVQDALHLVRPLVPRHVVIDARLEAVGAFRGSVFDVFQIVTTTLIRARDALGGRGERIAISLAAGTRPPERETATLTVAADVAASSFTRGHPKPITFEASVREAMERTGATLDWVPTDASAIHLSWSLISEGSEPIDLSDRTIVVVAGNAGAVARIVTALEQHGADVSLCLDPRDAIRTIAEARGLWDLAIVAGDVRGTRATELVARLRRADLSLAVTVAVPNADANAGTTIGHRDDATKIAATAQKLIERMPCAC